MEVEVEEEEEGTGEHIWQERPSLDCLGKNDGVVALCQFRFGGGAIGWMGNKKHDQPERVDMTDQMEGTME